MKILKLFLISFLFLLSCTKEDSVIIGDETKLIESFDFVNVEDLEKKEIEYRSMRDEIYSNLSRDFLSEIEDIQVDFYSKQTDESKVYKKEVVEDVFISELIDFHSKRLLEIYGMRKLINFKSIQSVVDEINSLKLISPQEAENLYDEYSDNITYVNGLAMVSDNISNPNITNAKGVLLFDGANINLNSNKELNENLKAKWWSFDSYNTDFYESSSHVSGMAIAELDLVGQKIEIKIQWGAGRSVTNYLLWTRSEPYTYYISTFKKYNSATGLYEEIEVPATFTPNTDSNCGFIHGSLLSGGDQWVDFPSGTGTSVRKYGDTKTGKMYLFGSADPSGSCEFLYNVGPYPRVDILIDVERFYLDKWIDAI